MTAIDLIAGTNPEPFSTSKTSNWVARTGGLPTLIQHVAHDLLESGSAHSVSDAIQKAVGIVRNWAHGHDGKGHAVKPQTVVEAVKAIAEWDAKRARARASKNLSRRVADLARRAFVADHLLREQAVANGREDSGVQGQPQIVERDGRRFLVTELSAPAEKGAMPGNRFPIRNHSDLKKAIRAVGRARPNTPEERAKVRRHIIRRAKAIGAQHLIPDSWTSSGTRQP